MTTYSVQIEALDELASRLKGLQNGFNTQGGLVSRYEDSVGSEDIAAALNDFARNWSDKRRELSKMLQEAAGYVLYAAAAYRETEQGLSENIQVSTGTTSAGEQE